VGACGTLSSPSSASGAAVTYTAPASISSNTLTAQIVAYAEAQQTANSISSITITTFNSSLAAGNYVLQAQGADSSLNPYQVAGVIKIDGQDIRRFKQKSLREQVSLVLQDTFLFHGPIWQNIAYGKPVASREEILRAAKLANASEFIEKMPEGYNTLVGERGATLSGGQRQRIAIARAIIRDAPILILDEPTSGLDAASEHQVFEALSRLMEGKTCIIVAHKLATIRRADIIFVVQDGAIVESGTHDELVTLGGLYSQFYELQFQAEEGPEETMPAK